MGANVGRDVVVFDVNGDLVETLEFSGAESVGEVAGWRWLLDGEPLPSGPTASADVTAGPPQTISLEVVSPTGNRDVDTAEVLVVDPENGPMIRSWYGPRLTVDRVQHPQRWVNILGEIVAARPLDGVTYSLDGGPAQPLTIGPNGNRLAQDGDFNVELELDALADGEHTVVIDAVDSVGDRSSETVVIDVFTGNEGASAPEVLEFAEIDDLAALTDVVPIDGRWTIGPEGIEVDPSYTGYDRLLGVGSRDLVDYEVRADLTIESYHPPSDASADRPAVGLILRWQGHNDSVEPGSLPHAGFLPNVDNPDDVVPAGGFGVLAHLEHRARGRPRGVPRPELLDAFLRLDA